jgi:MFS family permease
VIRTPTTRDYLAISIFYLAVSFFWGAMLSVVLQARVQTLVEADYVAAIKAGAMSQQQLEAAVAQKLSWLLSMGALVATVSQVLFGALSDRSRHRAGRRKPFLIAGVLGTNVGLLLFPFAHTYAQLFAVFLLLQLMLNLATGPLSSTCARSYSRTVSWQGGGLHGALRTHRAHRRHGGGRHGTVVFEGQRARCTERRVLSTA